MLRSEIVLWRSAETLPGERLYTNAELECAASCEILAAAFHVGLTIVSSIRRLTRRPLGLLPP